MILPACWAGSAVKGWFMWLIRKIGSVAFAVGASLILAVLLIISTSLEGIYGSAFAQLHFYQARWFDILLALLWLNIFCSTLLRFPYRKHHIGFLVTHIGILGLLMGALLTRLLGVEGRMIIYEGQQADTIEQDGHRLVATFPKGGQKVIELTEGNILLPLSYPGYRFSVRAINNAVEEMVVKEGNPGQAANLAANLQLKSRQLGFDEDLWLAESHPQNPHSMMAFIGPAQIVLKRASGETSQNNTPLLRVLNSNGQKLAEVDPAASAGQDIILDEDRKLVHLQFYPFARVVGNHVTDMPGTGKANPAVEFDVIDGQGRSQHYLKFAYFPEFEAMHAMPQQNAFNDLHVEFVAPEEGFAPGEKFILTCLLDREGRWRYRLETPDGKKLQGPIEPGRWVKTQWLDLSFRMDRILQRAVFSSQVAKGKGSQPGVFAVELTAEHNGEQDSQWAIAGQDFGFKTPTGNFRFKVTAADREIPFSLYLKEFRKTDYPGTDTPASFESDVVLKDPYRNVEIHKTISMNHPLDYRGFRVFQSSYIQNGSSGKGSVFKMSRNPGLPFIYLSSCTIFLGAFCQFYMRSNSNGKNENGSGENKSNDA